MLRRILIGSTLLLGLAIGACTTMLPERFAVNAPMWSQMFGGGIDAPPAEAVDSTFRTLPGLGVGLYASGLRNPRMLRPTDAGHLLVSLPRHGQVVLLEPDGDGDGLPDGRRVLLEGLDGPNSLELWQGWLVIGVNDGVVRVRFDPATGETEGAVETLVSGLPKGGNHWTRTARFGPDGGLYVTVGSSCNVCIEDDPRRAAMVRYEPDGANETLYATGLRNSVGFDWRPETGALYATDNGRDLLGDDFPPCELNRIVEDAHYGWPYANGARVVDPDLGAGHEELIASSLPPAHDFRAHTAPLGIAFLREPLPGDGRTVALAALHGSWNRSEKDGYEVVSLHWNADGTIEERDFLTGFLENEDVIGRPVDVAQAADGAIFVSDDYSGTIYRMRAGASTDLGASSTGARAADPLAGVPVAERAARAERGEALYAEHECASCHEEAKAAEGVVVAELEDLSARYDAEGLARFLVAPTPPMPAFPLDLDARRDLAVYLLQTRP